MHTLALETALRHDRVIAAAGLVVVAASAWIYTLIGVGTPMSGTSDMTAMAEGMRSVTMAPAAWSPSYAVMVLLMWWTMMVAMMVPSAAPLILLFAAIQRRKHPSHRPYRTTCALLAGYLTVWGLFSVVATFLQWGLQLSEMISLETLRGRLRSSRCPGKRWSGTALAAVEEGATLPGGVPCGQRRAEPWSVTSAPGRP